MDNQLLKIAGFHGIILAGFGLITGLLTFLLADVNFMFVGLILGIFGFLLQFILIIRGQLKYQKVNYDMTYGKAFLIGLIISGIGFVVSTVVSLFYISSTPEMSSMEGIRMTSIAISVVVSFIYVLIATMITSFWRLFEKAGKPGWASLVPFYNIVLMCEIGKKPTWWVLLCLIPIVNFVFIIMIYNGISKAFGKDEGWTAGLVLLGFVFFPLLAFGANYYQYEHIEGENPNNRNEENDLMEHLVT